MDAVRAKNSARVRTVNVPLGEPFVCRFPGPKGYIEFSVHPRGIGYGGPVPIPTLILGCFRGRRSPRSATISTRGRDPEGPVDLDELQAEWIASGDVSRLEGLVLAADLCMQWRLDAARMPFAEGCMWLPYRGDENR